MVDMEKDMTEALQTFTLGLETLKVYEVMRSQLNNVLDLLLPGDGHDLLPLRGQDWPALKDQVTGWMADQLQGMAYGRRSAADLRVRRREGGRRGRAPARRLLVGHGHPGRDRPGRRRHGRGPDPGQQAPPALRGGLLGPHLLTGRRGRATQRH